MRLKGEGVYLGPQLQVTVSHHGEDRKAYRLGGRSSSLVGNIASTFINMDRK